jgi:hypothetical protein
MVAEQAGHEPREGCRTGVALLFMSVKLGNEPRYEEAIRAPYASDQERFEAESEGWPKDLREYCAALAADAFREGD